MGYEEYKEARIKKIIQDKLENRSLIMIQSLLNENSAKQEQGTDHVTESFKLIPDIDSRGKHMSTWNCCCEHLYLVAAPPHWSTYDRAEIQEYICGPSSALCCHHSTTPSHLNLVLIYIFYNLLNFLIFFFFIVSEGREVVFITA